MDRQMMRSTFPPRKLPLSFPPRLVSLAPLARILFSALPVAPRFARFDEVLIVFPRPYQTRTVALLFLARACLVRLFRVRFDL